MNRDKPDFLDWLGLRRNPDFSKARWLGGLISIIIATILSVLLASALIEFVSASWSDDPKAEALRNSGLVLAAMIGVPFLVWRSVVAQKQVDVAEQGHITDRINTAVEGLGTEKTVTFKGRFVHWKLPEDEKEFRQGLIQRWGEGPDIKDRLPNFFRNLSETDMDEYLTFGKWTEISETTPNLEVRLGSIYALERIAQDSDRDHVQIMEILCAYIRQNAPVDIRYGFPDKWQKAFQRNWKDPNTERPTFQEIRTWAQALDAPRGDIQVALTVLGRRLPRQMALEGQFDRNNTWQGFKLDLRGARLQQADLENANFNHVRFDGSQLQAAKLRNAGLESAQFSKAQLQGTDLSGSDLSKAYISHCELQGANLTNASMQGMRIYGANLQTAWLLNAKMQLVKFDKVNFEDAFLSDAKLQGACFDTSDLDGAFFMKKQLNETYFMHSAKLRGSSFRNTSLAYAKLDQSQLDSIIGDLSVQVDATMVRPDHWLDIEYDSLSSCFEPWSVWKKKIGFDPEDPATW